MHTNLGRRISSLLTACKKVWAGEPQEQDDAVVIRCRCFSSLKAKTVCCAFGC